jgi:hypothetical protein
MLTWGWVCLLNSSALDNLSMGSITLANQQQDAWDPWPEVNPAQEEPMQLMFQDLNEAPVQISKAKLI